MKKALIKVGVLTILFVITIIVASKILNKDQDNITMDMESATLPMVSLVRGDFQYNQLHGYVFEQNQAFASETITVLGENRETGFHIDTYGQSVDSIDIEVRSSDGKRLIEQNPVESYKLTGWSIDGTITLKDLLESDTTYSLRIALNMPNEKTIYYYTDVIWSNNMQTDEKLAFVQDFHDKLFDKKNAADIKKYLETNSQLNDNKSYAKVDIHSSLDQVLYGDLGIEQLEEPKVYLKEISPLMAEIVLDYYAFETNDEDRIYYKLREYYRIKKGTERMLLIDYQREMEQLPKESELCINDKIVLGITDRNVDYMESEDGNTVAFISAGRLYSYQSTSGKLTKVFAFAGKDDFDERSSYDAHKIRILDIDESGTIKFAVYGYMNSGRHEGEVGIEIYQFDGKLNTIEELLYIPYEGNYGVLLSELDTLLYLNRDKHLFFTFENKVYCVDLDTRRVEIRSGLENDDRLTTSADHRVVISKNNYEDSNLSQSISLTNLKTESKITIRAEEGDTIEPMGFVGNDVIYGLAHISDIKKENSGKIVIPMYCMIICDEQGTEIKKYEYDNFYVTDVSQNDNQLILERVTIDANGRIKDAEPDYITTGKKTEGDSVTDATTIVDKYKTYVQLQLPKKVSENIKLTIPKEIVYEGERNLEIDIQIAQRYYVFDAFGLVKIYSLEANAVNMAYEKAGWVKDTNGTLLWKRTTRSTKNQIMAIAEDGVSEDRNSLAVCLDALMKNEGIIRNSNYLLAQGDSVLDILTNNLEGNKVLNLEDCAIDSILYYVNRETPVLVLTGTESALLIVGYNDANSYLVILNPDKGSFEKISYEDAERVFDDYGNFFITYVREGE